MLILVYLAFIVPYCKIKKNYEMEHYIFDFDSLNLLPRCMFFTPTKKLKRLV